MIVVAFVAFALLVVAWLVAPNGEPIPQPAPEPTPSPNAALGDAPAAVS